MSRIKAAQVACTADGRIYIIDMDGALWENSHKGTFVMTKIGAEYKWNQIACGGWHTVAIKTDGTLWGRGVNRHGQIGGTGNKSNLTQIETSNDWIQVACGDFHTVALKTDGTLWGLGYDTYGQLGCIEEMSVRTLTQIETDNNWAQVICGHWHTIALKTNGTLWRLGVNTFDLRKAENNRTFTQIESDNDWVDISCGQNHLVAIKTDGTLWGLGYNNYGQLAGDRTVYRSFTQIGASNNWAHVTCGRQCTLVIDMQGTLWECGGFDNERRKLVPINPKPNWVRSIDTEEYRLAIDPQGGVFVKNKDEEEGEEGDE